MMVLALNVARWIAEPDLSFNLELTLVFSLFVFAIASVPFILLAFLNVRGRGAWLAGIVLTFGAWGAVILDAVVRQGEGGANIGLAWMLLASPIWISAACLFAARNELHRRDPA